MYKMSEFVEKIKFVECTKSSIFNGKEYIRWTDSSNTWKNLNSLNVIVKIQWKFVYIRCTESPNS